MLKNGRVRVNGRVAHKMKDAIRSSDKIEVAGKSSQSEPKIPTARLLHPLKAIFEDEHLLVVDKPAGLLTSTVPGEKRPTALAFVREYLTETDPQARVGLIHRLDRDASGLLVFTKSDMAYRSLKDQFFKHTVRRMYVAVTHGAPTPPSGRIESRLVELPDGSVRSSQRPGAGERAVSEYSTIAREQGMAAVSVTLHTGRKHQIRVHLSERGVPIVGDRVYGKEDGTPRLMLAATTLGFAHPVSGAALKFELGVPRVFPIVGLRKQPSSPIA
jgi:23S rRNA pseudouridine1911/1915/1917 synthase